MPLINAIKENFTRQKALEESGQRLDIQQRVADKSYSGLSLPIVPQSQEEAAALTREGYVPYQNPSARSHSPTAYVTPERIITEAEREYLDFERNLAHEDYQNTITNPFFNLGDTALDILNNTVGLPFKAVGQPLFNNPSAKAEKGYIQKLEDISELQGTNIDHYFSKRRERDKAFTDMLTQKKQYSGIGSVKPVGVPQPSLGGLYQPMSDGSVRQYMHDGKPFKPTKQQLVDLGGGFKGIIDVNDPTPTPNEVVDQDTYIQNVRDTQLARTTGQETAKSVVNLETQMPTIREKVNKMLSTIEEVKNHKGKKKVVGSVIGNIFAGSILAAGTDEADFQSLFEMLSGEIFIEVREYLKGAGEVTDFEGQRGEDSMSALRTTNKVETFDKRLNDLKDMLIRALEVKENQLKGYKTTQGGNTYQVVE